VSKPSRYDVIWDALKADRSSHHPKGVQVSAFPSLHARIIKAVKKRKLIDLAYKYECLEKHKKVPRLDCKIDGNVITFKLFYDRMLEGIG